MKPIAKSVFLCDEVVADPESGKVSVLNLLNAVRVPADSRFPFKLGKLSVFGEFRDGLGTHRFQVKFRRADTGDVFAHSSIRSSTFKNPRQTVYVLFRMTDISFPVAGVYFVEMLCDDKFIDDQVLTVLDTGGDE